ncbi:TPA: hypothetical protein QB250_000770 [Pasteurella multocida]|nr:hypothetical protein [Pasteurella multocida]
MKKSIHYRHATITETKETLQALIEKALKIERLAIVENRIEKINSISDESRFINSHSAEGRMLFFQMVFIESGKQQTILDMEEGAKSYPIQAFNLNGNEQDKKRRKEFVNSILYALIFNNHLVVLKSKALSERDLENHLYWLLVETSEIIPQSQLGLAIQPPKQIRELTTKEPVKKVLIGTELAGAFTPEEKKEDIDKQQDFDYLNELSKEVIDTKSIKFSPKVGMDILKSLFNKELFESKDFIDCLDESNLKVNLEITYDRKTTVSGQSFIDSIAHSLRHVDDDDVKIVLKNGGILRGSQVKLSGDINVKMNDNGIIDETDLRKQMRDWLLSKIDQDEIELDPTIDKL